MKLKGTLKTHGRNWRRCKKRITFSSPEWLISTAWFYGLCVRYVWSVRWQCCTSRASTPCSAGPVTSEAWQGSPSEHARAIYVTVLSKQPKTLSWPKHGYLDLPHRYFDIDLGYKHLFYKDSLCYILCKNVCVFVGGFLNRNKVIFLANMTFRIAFLNTKTFTSVIGLNYFLTNYMTICNNLTFWPFFLSFIHGLFRY